MPDDKFDNNPFRNLDASLYPEKTARDKFRIKSGVEKARRAKVDCPDDCGEAGNAENEMFLRAMARVVKTPVKKQDSGFTLSDHCALPNAACKKKPQKDKTQSAQPPEKKIADAEAEAFLLAMRTATPLGGKGRKVAPPPVNQNSPIPEEPAFGDLLEDSLIFSVSCSDEYLEGYVAGLDELIMNRLRQGQLSPEAHLDLHGLNAMQAFENLKEFMRSSWFKGLRTVLLVPGRGRNSPDGQGILRKKLQSWLTQEPFKRVVLGFCTAQPRDGGPGSIYVLLRKDRKKGRIYWERMPADADLY